MRIHGIKSIVGLAALALAAGISCVRGPDDRELLSAARKTTDVFAAQLKAALTSALSDSGVVGAVEICSEMAPRIAGANSACGFEIKRTSLRFRNPQNAPDQFESGVLLRLEENFPLQDEFYSWSDADRKRVFRYLKSIKIVPLCQNCHGDPAGFDSALVTSIAARYPDDKATGYKNGDFRGAFSVKITWPDARATVDSINRSP